jgi:SAM-dependent methyltransferase
MDRKEKLCRFIQPGTQKGLEFGPLSKPTIRKTEGDIRYVDALTTEQIRANFATATPYLDAEFCEIDYIWNGEGLDKVVGEERFDYAIASHVIEHVPDVIGWLNDILSVLKPSGVLGLVIPDKRYTFDVRRKESTLALMLDNWVRKERKPTAYQVFDHFSQVVKVATPEVQRLWRDDLDPMTVERHHDDALAISMVRNCLNPDRDYQDCHAYTFTPFSFLTNLRKLVEFGLIKASLLDFYTTDANGIEFVAVLRAPSDDGHDTSDSLASIDVFLDALPAAEEAQKALARPHVAPTTVPRRSSLQRLKLAVWG